MSRATAPPRPRPRAGRPAGDEGSSLVEVLVSVAILATAAAALMSMASLALTQTENQGHLAARTAEYAQDKMEQLLVLAFGDETSDTRVFPAAIAGGTGLAPGGNLDPNAPEAGYADYLDRHGNLLPAPGGQPPDDWFFQRVWRVDEVTPTLKQVSVTTIVAHSIGRTRRPGATLTTLKSHPF